MLVGAERTSTTNRRMCVQVPCLHCRRCITQTAVRPIPFSHGYIEQQCSSNLNVCGQHHYCTDAKLHADILPGGASFARQEGRRRAAANRTRGNKIEHKMERKHTHGTEWNSPCGRVVAIASAVGGSERCCWSGGVGRLACGRVDLLAFVPLFPTQPPPR